MNQSIGCGPMPFALAGDKAAAESATILPGASPGTETETSFSAVLDSELKDEARPPKEEAEAWAVYGIAPPVVQFLPTVLAVSLSEVSSVVEEGALLNGTSQPESIAESLIEPTSKKDTEEGVPAEHAEEMKSALRALKLAEQKVPSLSGSTTPAPEQFAENPSKPAKIAYGMVAAQGQLMVSDTSKQEETAREQSLPLSADTIPLTDSEIVSVKPTAPLREKVFGQDTAFIELVSLDGPAAEWSSFEGISETSESNEVSSSESIEIAQAIRTHVQLLKGSSQDKLDVVLRPDGNTELRLVVEKVNGQILVQARCDRGDFARLDANWTAVQQSLANQGVRVESLQHGQFHYSQNSSQNPGGFQQHSAPEQQRQTNFIEHELKAPKNRQPVASRGTVRGWQSWA